MSSRPSIARVHVGNDVVDLGRDRTVDRSSDDRFLGRVLSPDERRAMESSGDPESDLWSRWAAKEAAFKVVSKELGHPPPFILRALVVRWAELPREPIGARGSRGGAVSYGDRSIPVRVCRSPGAIHALAASTSAALRDTRAELARLDESEAPWSGGLEELRGSFTPRELDSIHSESSAAVRLGARHALAQALRILPDRVEIVCKPGPIGVRPPFVLVDGHPSDADVSLSHDGRWVAWSLWIPR